MNFRNTPLRMLTVIGVASLGAGSALAQEATHMYDRPRAVQSDATRAEVIADMQDFRASGGLPGYSSKRQVRPRQWEPAETRAEVKAETVKALKTDEINSDGEVFRLDPSNSHHVPQG